MSTLKQVLETRRKQLDSPISPLVSTPRQPTLSHPIILQPHGTKTQRFIVMSDTHLHHTHIQLSPLLPTNHSSKPILLHCGDFTNSGSPNEVEEFVNYLQSIHYHF